MNAKVEIKINTTKSSTLLSLLKGNLLNKVIYTSLSKTRRLSNHTNPLAISLLDETEEVRRLNRLHIAF
ncbi:hypothetical protein CVS40_11791 [Lucilia cuprina]|nr:hypothetical protein CVS40_11791 [Lucilia cuprina]